MPTTSPVPARLRPRTSASLVAMLLIGFLGLVGVPAASAAPVDAAAPATIRVCRSSGGVDTVSFKEYVKVVLPVEFPADWPAELLKAGAVAIKSYAWYHVLHPISDACDIGDTTRYQLYDPSMQRRSAGTDAAVEATWHLRLDDTDRNQVAYTQYCSGGCASHKRYAGEGRYLDQDLAREYAAGGWDHVRLLQHFYRNLPSRLWSWTSAFALSTTEDVVDLDQPPAQLTLGVGAVAPGDERVRAHAFVVCTVAGSHAAHPIQDVPVTADADGVAIVRFDDLAGLTACEDDEASFVVQLVVNGHVAVSRTIPAWRRWTAAALRDVERFADTADPVAGSVQVSRAVFDAVAPEDTQQDDASMLTGMLGIGDDESAAPPRHAEYAVLARSDAFPDALGATALAGRVAPILLTPGGADEPLAAGVRDEIVRILEPGAEVRIVGGVGAVSQGAQDELEALGYLVVRISGADRIATAQAITDFIVDGEPVERVILVRGFPDTTAGWADAVAVGPWAARTGTPILVTPASHLDATVEAWIEDPAHGVEEVLVIGGTAAVPGTAETLLDGVTVTRFRGARRDATALAIADELWGTRTSPEARHVVVADVYGRGGWAFAVAGSVPAAIGDAAALSVADLVPPTTVGVWLDGRPDVSATIVGGPGVVTAKVEESINGPGEASS